MKQRYASNRRGERRLGPGSAVVAAAAAALLVLPADAPAQVEEGISLGLTPAAERLYWNGDMTLSDAWYWGGRVSLNFGRFVALEGYYLEGDDVETPEPGPLLQDARRFGGDVVFTLASWDFTPFVRLGAGLSEFEISEGGTSEILTGTAAAGFKFDLFDRLQTQVFAQDVAFRASGSSPLVDATRVPEDEAETLHNLAIGAGINLFLGGRAEQTETDRAFEEGIRGVASPLELYGGEIRWSSGVGLPDLPVAGARLGVDFGPWVGLTGYYFGSVDDGFDDFTDYFGYGAEGRFNLTRSDEAFTPFLVLGGGRIHFPDTLAEAAGFDDDTKWNAVVGGGVGFNLTERLRLEASARDLVLSTIDPENVTAPDQLEHSWVYTAGLRFAIGGDTERPELPEALRGGMRGEGVRGEEARGEDMRPRDVAEEGLPTTTLAEDTVRDTAGMRELREEVDRLRRMLEGEGTQVRTAGTFELPVLENGEIYVRFGESGTFERRTDDSQDLSTALMIQRLQALRADLDQAPEDPRRDSLSARLQEIEEAVRTPRARQTDDPGLTDPGLTDRLDRLQARIDSLSQEPSAREADMPDFRLRELELRLESRIQELERRLDESEDTDAPRPVRPGGGGVEAETEPQIAAPERGVLRGAPMRLWQISPFAGPGFGEPDQLHLGVKADMGSAFGGSGRFVPQLNFGITDDFTWSANAHIEWPVPLRIGRAEPFVGTGVGLADHDGLDLLIPNFIIGTSYPVDQYRLFGAIHGLDAFDDTRVVIGFHARPPNGN